MKRITLDEPLRAQLHGLHGPVHLCDEDGYLLATIEPVDSNGSNSSLVTYTEELCQLLGNIADGVEFSERDGTLVARITPFDRGGQGQPIGTMHLDDLKQRRADGESRITTAELIDRLRNR